MDKKELELIRKQIELRCFDNKKTIDYHLNSFEKHFGNEKWDDTCLQLRKVLEQILTDIAYITSKAYKEKIFHKHHNIQNSEILEYLLKKGFVDHNEKNHVNSFYGLLSNKSAHPGIPKKEDALHKIEVGYLIIKDILSKFDVWIHKQLFFLWICKGIGYYL